MGHKDQGSDSTITPPGDAEVLIQRIRDLQKGKDDLFFLLSDAERKLRSLLEELDINESLLPIAESEGVDDLINTLFVAVRVLCHEIECRGRDQKRLHKIIESFQGRVRQLARDNKVLERDNEGLRMKIDLLEGEVRRVKRRKNRKTE